MKKQHFSLILKELKLLLFSDVNVSHFVSLKGVNVFDEIANLFFIKERVIVLEEERKVIILSLKRRSLSK